MFSGNESTRRTFVSVKFRSKSTHVDLTRRSHDQRLNTSLSICNEYVRNITF